MVDTLGHLLALQITPANEQDWAPVGAPVAAVQQLTGETIKLAYGDQDDTREPMAQAVARHGVALEGSNSGGGTGLRTLAPPLGRGALLRLDAPLPVARQ